MGLHISCAALLSAVSKTTRALVSSFFNASSSASLLLHSWLLLLPRMLVNGLVPLLPSSPPYTYIYKYDSIFKWYVCDEPGYMHTTTIPSLAAGSVPLLAAGLHTSRKFLNRPKRPPQCARIYFIGIKIRSACLYTHTRSDQTINETLLVCDCLSWFFFFFFFPRWPFSIVTVWRESIKKKRDLFPKKRHSSQARQLKKRKAKFIFIPSRHIVRRGATSISGLLKICRPSSLRAHVSAAVVRHRTVRVCLNVCICALQVRKDQLSTAP